MACVLSGTAKSTPFDSNPKLGQAAYTYQVQYYFQNKIAYVDYMFPESAWQKLPVVLDL